MITGKEVEQLDNGFIFCPRNVPEGLAAALARYFQLPSTFQRKVKIPPK
ncbi:hypothetical protein L798_01566 [Zootermopsis nevadensis]|uniref:Uncharacterized protein n=1 Tax=Zootermopsis nevadensis TaxID=136037 RepID=A0A067QJB1_ZOONE|nr:hypothetical protein L798_01566 [Zootermopsis nevadensis]